MITISNLTKTFGAYTALKEINLDIQKGELLALLGPSGCGKTTLLRIIAGLDYPDTGAIQFNGEDVTYESPQARKIGFVFQHFALFRHMTVFDNIAFGLTVLPKQSRPSKEEIREKVLRLLKLIQMEWLADAYPGKLSGGQRQRVALARALAIEPGVLLLDEPFSSLDATVRRELRRWLKRLHDELHITSIFVTHDQEEALEVANRVVVMNKGTVEQIGTPEEVYDHPVNRFVYHFLGDVNIFEGRLRDGQFDHTGAVPGIDDDKAPAVGLIRPHEVELTTEPLSGTIPARVLSFRSAGPIVRVELSRNDNNETVTAEVKKSLFQSLGVQPDSQVYLIIEGMKVFVDEGAHI